MKMLLTFLLLLPSLVSCVGSELPPPERMASIVVRAILAADTNHDGILSKEETAAFVKNPMAWILVIYGDIDPKAKPPAASPEPSTTGAVPRSDA